MTAITKMTVVESKLLLRDLGSLFTLVIPVFFLLVFASSISPGDTVLLSIVVAISVGLVGLYMVPATLAGYRERGILRRLSVTPVSPAMLLGVQLVLQLAYALISSTVVVVVATTVFKAGVPPRVLPVLVTFLLGAASLIMIGLVIAAITPDARVANGLGVLLYFPLAYLAGMMQPVDAMPALIVRIGELTPLGAFRRALQDVWAGGSADPVLLGTMAVYAVGFGAIAARFFRWE